MATVRVRFAPSPTGYLHVGGARTAIFNWLFARRHGGTFVLRIEDTDEQRSSDEVTQAILDGMAWLGMTPDEGPFFQSAARERHASDARRLLAAGRAYRCFCAADDLKRERAEAESRGDPSIYPRRCRGVASEESARRADAGVPHAIRFLVPDETISWDDGVHRTTSFDASLVEDFVLLRSDGSPTYMLSVVSDDVAMGITHVIRGDDHLSNTPKQILLYRALGATPPVFAHLPLILGEDRRRLSKRHGATSVLEYRDRGFLPDALFNFLALLGWSPGDDRQRMSRPEMIDAFDLEGIGRSGAIFDLKKLEWLNGQYIADLPLDDFETAVRPFLEGAGLWRDAYAGPERSWFLKLLGLLQPRTKTLSDVVTEGRPFLDPSDELVYDPAVAAKHLGAAGLRDRLEALRSRFEEVEPWEPAGLEAVLRSFADAQGIAAGTVIHPLRLALTGRGASPGIFDVLDLLGRQRSLRRLSRLIDHLAT